MLHIENGSYYGNLRIIRELDQRCLANGRRRRQFLCQCDCGNVVEILLFNLVGGNSRTCGCSRVSHGLQKHYIVDIWHNIKKRCFNENNPRYSDYGDRGITMYGPWIDDCRAFYDYIIQNLGERPCGKSFDRIDNERGYFPGNLRWASVDEQANNKRNNKCYYAPLLPVASHFDTDFAELFPIFPTEQEITRNN